MFNVYFSIASVFIVIGLVTGILFALTSTKRFLGGMWAAILVGILGAFLGGIVWYLMEPLLTELTNLFGVVNIYPPVIASVFVVWVYKSLSHKE